MKHDSFSEAATNNWSQPAYNKDPRSSGNGLLSISYGSLEQAARKQWSDSHLPIIDTDFEILLASCKPKQTTLTQSNTREALVIFIKESLKEDWNEYDDMTHIQRQEIAINLVNSAASSIFGDIDQTAAASWLLFYVCPQLPVFPVTGSLDNTNSYADYYLSQKQKFTLALPSLDQNIPEIHYGNQQEQSIIKELLTANNWWQRYLFVHLNYQN